MSEWEVCVPDTRTVAIVDAYHPSRVRRPDEQWGHSRSVDDLTFPVVVVLSRAVQEVVRHVHLTARYPDGRGFYTVGPGPRE